MGVGDSQTSEGAGSAYQGMAVAGGNLLQAGIASAFNVHETRQNRRFQRNMANSAHQREVKDLIAAGLNPVLSANHGGAQTPPTSAAQIQLPQSGSDYLAGAAQKQNAGLIQAQTRNLNAQAQKAEVDARVAAVSEPFSSGMAELESALKKQDIFRGDVETSPEALRALAKKIVAEASSAGSSAALLQGQIPAAFNQTEMSKTWYGKHVLPYIRSILDASGVYKNVIDAYGVYKNVK